MLRSILLEDDPIQSTPAEIMLNIGDSQLFCADNDCRGYRGQAINDTADEESDASVLNLPFVLQ